MSQRFPNLIDEFNDLKKLLSKKSGFNFFIAQYNDPQVKTEVLGELIQEGFRCATFDLSSTHVAGAGEFTSRLKELSSDVDALFLTGIENRETDYQRFLGALNLSRETIAAYCRTNLVLWIHRAKFKDVVQIAPDLFAWHSYVLDFCIDAKVPAMEMEDISVEWVELQTIETKKRIRRLIDHLSKLSETDVFKESEKELLNELLEFNRRIVAYFGLGYEDPDLSALQKEIDTVLLKKQIILNLASIVSEQQEAYFVAPHDRAEALQTGDVEKNPDLLETALESHIANLGEGHPNVAIHQYNLASVYYRLGEYEKARHLLEKASGTFKKTLGENHPFAIAAKKRIQSTKKTPSDLIGPK